MWVIFGVLSQALFISHGAHSLPWDVIRWLGFISTRRLGTHCRQDFSLSSTPVHPAASGEAPWPSLKHLHLYLPRRKFSIFSKLVLSSILYLSCGPIQSPTAETWQVPWSSTSKHHSGDFYCLSSRCLILLPHCFWSLWSTSIKFLIPVTILCFLFDS